MNGPYDIVISWSHDDDCFVAEVPDLPGCMADGRSSQEAAASAEVVIKEWIELAVELGRAIPEPRHRPHSA
jgi:predicted RNase H-like HicB family nuclease